MMAWIMVLTTAVMGVAVEKAPNTPTGPRQRGPQRQAPMRPGAPNIDKFIDKVADAVDATEEQVTQLEAIAAEHRAAMEAIRTQHQQLTEEQQAQVSSLHEQVREARRAGDDAKVEELRAQIHELMGADPRELLTATRDQIAAVLTPEQLPIFEKMAAELRPGQEMGRRGRGFGRGGPGGPGGPGNALWMGLGIQRFIDRLGQEVELTDAQQEQLATIAAEHAEAMKATRGQAAAAAAEHREELAELRQDMREARADGDAEAVAAIRAKMRELMGKPVEENLQASLDKIAAVLTEEQLPAFQTLVEETKDRIGERPWDGPRRGGRGDGAKRGPRGQRGPRPVEDN